MTSRNDADKGAYHFTVVLITPDPRPDGTKYEDLDCPPIIIQAPVRPLEPRRERVRKTSTRPGIRRTPPVKHGSETSHYISAECRKCRAREAPALWRAPSWADRCADVLAELAAARVIAPGCLARRGSCSR